MKNNSPHYHPAVDGLRAAAVMPVVVFHANATIMPGGYIGVDLFFVISGYLVTSVLLRELNKSNYISLIAFYRRRALRIWPASFAMLAVYFLAVITFSPNHSSQLIAVATSAAAMMNWQRALTNWPDFYLGHNWSLSIEEQFYALWPLLLILLSKGVDQLHLYFVRLPLPASFSGVFI